jgi:hypothetical protein
MTRYAAVRRCGDEIAVLVDLDCLLGTNALTNISDKVDKAIVSALVEHSLQKLWPIDALLE